MSASELVVLSHKKLHISQTHFMRQNLHALTCMGYVWGGKLDLAQRSKNRNLKGAGWGPTQPKSCTSIWEASIGNLGNHQYA